MKKLITIMLLASISLVGYSQQTHNLTIEEQEAFKAQCEERIDSFQEGLQIIADKEQPSDIKNHYIKTLPDMFLGKGDPWVDSENVKHKAVIMQVSSLNRSNPLNVPLKEYLNKLRTLRYTYVEITKAKICRISNFYQVNDNLYMGTCTFYQCFNGKSGETVVYRDKTQKDVDVYIQRVEDGSLGTYWDMKFGDINVTETQRVE